MDLIKDMQITDYLPICLATSSAKFYKIMASEAASLLHYTTTGRVSLQ